MAAIANYIAQDNLDAALRWLDDLDQMLQLLSEHPLLGEDVSSLRPGVRRYVIGSYLIFYRPTNEGVLVIRVLHSARRIEDLL